MSMDFPDRKSLINAASVHKFRMMYRDETEAKYREELANHVFNIDKIESGEIRYGVGWDRWTDGQKSAELKRIGLGNWKGQRLM
ncbi:hypothetical protein LCGC14_1268830 [marine sediment metagenome]|uniref:Uncharacterized protein n=1 Tax=marine sediment metagenome TaxID=412755 RepID=A0A0F9L0K4_9ZZZZ